MEIKQVYFHSSQFLRIFAAVASHILLFTPQQCNSSKFACIAFGFCVYLPELKENFMKVAVIMGSTSDYEIMSAAIKVLEEFGVEYEKKVISAHRTPDLMCEYAKSARERGIGAIIAGAGGAAHVAGVVAGMTTVPVIGVPIQTKALGGMDSLLSIVQMPGGIPVATMAINGAKNAGLFAVQILALTDPALEQKLSEFRKSQTQKVLDAVI